MYKYNAYVKKVLDGDTCDVNIDLGFDIHINQRLRFFAIDCPESRTRDKEEKKHGLMAKEYTKNAIEGKDILIETNEKGKFGRYLATIYYKGKNLNKELIAKNLAKPYFGGKR